MGIAAKAFGVATMVAASLGTAAAALAAQASCQGIVVPSYFYPAAGSGWDAIKGDASARSRVAIMIINPNSGVGTAVDANYVAVVPAMQRFGIKVLGYVPTGYGTRPLAQVNAEIAKYKSWYKVDGIFVDETAVTAAEVSYYRKVAATIRTGSGGFVMLNPGAFPENIEYIRMADTTVVFEQSYRTYLTTWAPPSWFASFPAAKFTHIVHSTPNTVNAISKALALSRSRDAGLVYVTDDVMSNPYDRLPTAWQSELAIMTKVCAAP